MTYEHPIKNMYGQMLATKPQYNKLVANHETHEANMANYDPDVKLLAAAPVIKLFTPDGNATWLISELDPKTGIMFGLCDLGRGDCPQMGSVDLGELLALRGRFGLPIERDRHIRLPDVPLSVYAAQSHDRIVIPEEA